MSRLLAYMGNDPQRLRCALHPGRALLASAGADPRHEGWGVGFYQGGEVLLQRRPKPFRGAFDLHEQLRDVRTDALLAQVQARRAASTAGPADVSKSEDTPPFRFRSWLFALHGGVARFPAQAEELLAPVPDYLRRNMRGHTDAELVFHLFLAGLHAGGMVNDPDLAPRRAARAIADAIAHCDRVLGDSSSVLDVAATNGRILVVTRRGAPLYHYRVEGLRSCPVCRDLPQSLGGFRAGDHEHLRAEVLLATDGEPKPEAPWTEIPEGSVVTVSRELRLEIQPLAPADA